MSWPFSVVRARGIGDQRTDAFSRMIFRSEAFTASELENTLATSGSKTTTFVPCA